MIGNYARRSPTAAARSARAAARVAHGRRAHRPAFERARRLRAGTRSTARACRLLRAISGHRDTGFTTCPGRLYGDLRGSPRRWQASACRSSIRPKSRGRLGQFVSFSARLSTALPWTVTITDTTGRQAAQGSGFGTNVQDLGLALRHAARLPLADRAGVGVRLASGTLGLPAARRSSRLLPPIRQASPLTATGRPTRPPSRTNWQRGDGPDRPPDRAGKPLATLQTAEAAGRHLFAWNGGGYPDGRYRIVVAARSRGREVTATTNVVLSRTPRSGSCPPPSHRTETAARTRWRRPLLSRRPRSRICPSGAGRPAWFRSSTRSCRSGSTRSRGPAASATASTR